MAKTLNYLNINITWRGVHYWIQKIGEILEEVLWKNNGDLPDIVIVDETKIKLGSQFHYLYAAHSSSTYIATMERSQE